jgi:hypothetical protein
MNEKRNSVEWTAELVSGFALSLAGAKASRLNVADVPVVGNMKTADFIKQAQLLGLELFSNPLLKVNFQMGDEQIMQVSIAELDKVYEVFANHCKSTGKSEPLKVWPSAFPSYLDYMEIENTILTSVIN